jgi:hypothetical protein
MSTSGGRGNGGEDRGRGGRSGRGNKGSSAKGSGSTSSSKFKGAITALEDHVFDYGTKGAAEQMRRTWERIVNYESSKHGPQIGSELRKRQPHKFTVPQFDPEEVRLHEVNEAARKERAAKDLAAAQANLVLLQSSVPTDPEKIYRMTEEVNKHASELKIIKPFVPTEQAKGIYNNAIKSYDKKVDEHNTNRGKAHADILGQCSPELRQKLECDPTWDSVLDNLEDPLALYSLIQKTILSQTEMTFVCTHMYDQTNVLMAFRQNHLSIANYKDQFETKVKIAGELNSFCVTPACLEYEAQQLYSKPFTALSDKEAEETREAAEERYLAYHFIRNSGPQYNRYRQDLTNQFLQGTNNYPPTCQGAYRIYKTTRRTPPLQSSPKAPLSFNMPKARTSRIRVPRARKARRKTKPELRLHNEARAPFLPPFHLLTLPYRPVTVPYPVPSITNSLRRKTKLTPNTNSS